MMARGHSPSEESGGMYFLSWDIIHSSHILNYLVISCFWMNINEEEVAIIEILLNKNGMGNVLVARLFPF